MIVFRENLMAVVRTALKGLLLGMVVGTFLAMVYFSILFAPPARADSSELTRVLSLLFGLPTLLILTSLDMFGTGAITPYFIGATVTGAIIGAAAPILGRRVKLWPFVGLITAVAAVVAGAWLAQNIGVSAQFSIFPAALYVAFSAWLAYRVRVGGVQ
jgi:hypothetical protein